MSCLRFTIHDCDSVKAIHVISKFGLFPSSQDTIQLPRDLGEIGEFQDLSPEPLEELSKLMKLRLYVPQQVILQQGLVDLNGELIGLGVDPKGGLQGFPNLNQLKSTAPDFEVQNSISVICVSCR